jgi:pilus assembly protein CpaB
LVAGLLVALVAGVVAFVTLSRGAERQEVAGQQIDPGTVVDVVVAAQAQPPLTLLTAEMLAVKQIPVQAAPEGYLSETEEAAGKMTTTELAAGEILLTSRLVTPDVVTGDGRLAVIMNDDQVLMAFPANDLMNSLGVLKPGDHVDLLFSLDFPLGQTGEDANETELVTFNALQNQTIAAIVGGQPADEGEQASQAKALLLTVSPQDALTLKYLKDANATMDVVLRAPGADQPFETEPVDIDRIINENRIPLGVGR